MMTAPQLLRKPPALPDLPVTSFNAPLPGSPEATLRGLDLPIGKAANLSGVDQGMPGFHEMAAELARADEDWAWQFDSVDVHTCPLSELQALQRTAPAHFLKGYLSGITVGRLEVMMITGRGLNEADALQAGGDPDFDLKRRLERRFRQWASRLDEVHLFSCPMGFLRGLLEQAPHPYWQGFLSGVLTTRTSIATITGRSAP